MPTGLQIRAEMTKRGAPRKPLVRLGRSTALAGGTNRLRDAVRYDMDTQAPSEHSDAYIRITSVSNSDRGLVAKVKRINPDTGDIFFDPPAGAAIVSGTTYELWQYGIRPDDSDRARDRALTQRCSYWQPRPLSVLADVADWPVAAYSATAGGVTSAAGAATTLAFPEEFARQSMLVTNSGVNGLISSERYRVQPQQQFRLWGRVSARAQTPSVRVRDLTNTADITLQANPASTFTLLGWQWWEVTFTVPALCGEIQVWLGGASATCIGEWSAVGLLPTARSRIPASARVRSEHDVGQVVGYDIAADPNSDEYRRTYDGVERKRFSDGVQFIGVEADRPVFYDERHAYAALQTDYLAASDRTTGDDATTDCRLEYAEAATTCELLGHMGQRDPELAQILIDAEKDLNYWESQQGPDAEITPEPRNQARPVLLGL